MISGIMATQPSAKKHKTVENPMRAIKLEKVVLNIGCGGDEGAIERAKKLLAMLTGDKKTVVTLSKRRSTFGITKNKPVGVKITLRGKHAMDMIKMSFAGVDNRIKASQFNDQGNFNFGVKEYIELPGVKYRHDIGMMGFDVTVSLKRAGFGIKDRHVQKRKIPSSHKINIEESIKWVKDNFGVEIVE
jgi:large subunit ribosomal protein L5